LKQDDVVVVGGGGDMDRLFAITELRSGSHATKSVMGSISIKGSTGKWLVSSEPRAMTKISATFFNFETAQPFHPRFKLLNTRNKIKLTGPNGGCVDV
jgi:hypothetical protein